MLLYIFSSLLIIYAWSMPIRSHDHQEKEALLSDAKTYNGTEEGFIGLSACSWHSYKQCDSAWGSQPLGTGGGNTICSAGCAMTSVAMMLGHYGVNNENPGELNKWLDSHGGYADGDLLVWSAVDSLGSPHPSYQGQEKPSVATLQTALSECHGLVANVRSGSHWVLLTGYAGNDVFYVNDPGFAQTT
eukprot:UN07510